MSTTTPTPRDDAAVTGNSDPQGDEYEDLAQFARQLERELAVSKAAEAELLERLQERTQDYLITGSKRVQELNETRKELLASQGQEVALRRALEGLIVECEVVTSHAGEKVVVQRAVERASKALHSPAPAVVPVEEVEGWEPGITLEGGLAGALEWAMGMEPSPCRCLDVATPPHVCRGHRALEAYRAKHPRKEGGA